MVVWLVVNSNITYAYIVIPTFSTVAVLLI